VKNILRALLIAAAALTAASAFNHPSASVLDDGAMLAFGTALPVCPPVCPNPGPPACDRSRGPGSAGKVKAKKNGLPQPHIGQRFGGCIICPMHGLILTL
jgi:hypothetical protein